MSLFCCWSSTPRAPAGRAAAVDRPPGLAAGLALAPLLRWLDNVPLLRLAAEIGAGDGGQSLVGLDRLDREFADIAPGGGLHVHLVARDQAVVGADAQLDVPIPLIHAGDLPLQVPGGAPHDVDLVLAQPLVDEAGQAG